MTAANPPSPRRSSIPSILVYTAFAVALIYLLQLQLSSAAAMQASHAVPGAELLDQIDSLIATAANGQSLELHLQTSPEEWTRNGNFLTRIYVSAVYHQYPSPVVIGNGRAIINSPADLQRADQVASDDWLSHRGIHRVVTLLPGDQTAGWQALIHPVH